MSEPGALTVLCLASYEKGFDFLRECKRQGCYVILFTADRLRDNPWPHDSIDEFHTLHSLADREALTRAINGVAHRRTLDRIVPLDDYDVETAAALREHLRVPGMGETTARYFRDKLAMRVQARDKGIPVPQFVHALNYDRVGEFIARVPPPWLLKPRSEASAVGIKKLNSPEELWQALNDLGDRQSYYVLEQYVPGDVFHVDSIVYEREVLFAEAHGYGAAPLDIMQSGGIFITRTLPRESPQAQELKALHAQVLQALGFVRGVTHTEYIRGREDGRLHFLETGARVGGAHIADLVEAATGLNLWAEWAKAEIAGGERPYSVPEHRQDYAGLIISLARQEHPDTGAYNDPEVVWRLDRHHHAGLIVASPDPERVQTLLDSYTRRFYEDFFASQPPPDRPTS